MKNAIIFLALIFIVTGCVSVTQSPSMETATAVNKGKPLSDVHRVKLGMKKSEVSALLGDELVIGYRVLEEGPNKTEPITIPQPYRSEEFRTDKGDINVLYYVSSVRRADGIISEEELTPLIFKDDELIGKGIDELQRIKQN